MTDETETNSKETEETTKEPDKPLSDVDKVKKELAEFAQTNNEIEKELLRKEELKAKMRAGGQSDAGQEPEKPKEETPKEYNDRIDKEISSGMHDD